MFENVNICDESKNKSKGTIKRTSGEYQPLGTGQGLISRRTQRDLLVFIIFYVRTFVLLLCFIKYLCIPLTLSSYICIFSHIKGKQQKLAFYKVT